MIDSKPDCSEARASAARFQWWQYGVLAVTCVVVFAVYVNTTHPGYSGTLSLNAADAYYNLLVQGFRAGQLSLKKEVPPGLAQLADPYDRTANTPYGALDLSYYKGKFYLYFGVTPALVLFWPHVALTGHYLFQTDATLVFCLVGFLASAGLLCALWRRYFAVVSGGVVAAGTLGLGLATFTPFLLARCDVYEVPISCGYALTMLALAAMWKSLHEPERRSRWLAAAGLAYGLAVGARPSLLPGAVILLLPVIQTWRERRKVWLPLMAATGPLVLIGLGLMLYNALRFDNPLEFGQHYQLAGERLLTRQFFSLRYLWFNFRVFFLEPARWSARFPFVHDIAVPPLPAGYGRAEHPFGVLSNIPLVWLALAVALGWRRRPEQAHSILRWFVTAVVLLFGSCALTIGLFCAACIRYEVEFLPALVLLAVIGILSLERNLAPTSESGQTGRSVWRRAVRWGWGLLLGFSVAFNLLVSVERCGEAHYDLGVNLSEAGKTSEAIAQYERALQLKPDYAEAHNNLGNALAGLGRVTEAVGHWEQALRIKPGYAAAHINLGNALLQMDKFEEAIRHYDQALRTRSDYAEAHYNLGTALRRTGKVEEAIRQYEQALGTDPNMAEAHYDLGTALAELGKAPEAMEHWEQALRIKPDYPEAHNNLGTALRQTGKIQEAIRHYEEALRTDPDMAEAHYNLGIALAGLGRVPEAMEHWEQALRIEPGYPEAHYNLGVALAGFGKTSEAIAHWEQALRVKPDYAEAHYNLGVALEQMGQIQEAKAHWEQALRIKPDYAKAQERLAPRRATQ